MMKTNPKCLIASILFLTPLFIDVSAGCVQAATWGAPLLVSDARGPAFGLIDTPSSSTPTLISTNPSSLPPDQQAAVTTEGGSGQASILAAINEQNRLLLEQIELLKHIDYATSKLLQGARTGGFYR